MPTGWLLGQAFIPVCLTPGDGRMGETLPPHLTGRSSSYAMLPVSHIDGVGISDTGQTAASNTLHPTPITSPTPIPDGSHHRIRTAPQPLTAPQKLTSKHLFLTSLLLANLFASTVLAISDLEGQTLLSENFWQLAKVLALSVTALSSIATGASAYFLSLRREDPSAEKRSQSLPFAEFLLRGACTLGLAAFAFMYVTWYLCPHPERFRAFGLLRGVCLRCL